MSRVARGREGALSGDYYLQSLKHHNAGAIIAHFAEEETWLKVLQLACGPVVNFSAAPPPQSLFGCDKGAGVEGKRKGSQMQDLGKRQESLSCPPPTPTINCELRKPQVRLIPTHRVRGSTFPMQVLCVSQGPAMAPACPQTGGKGERGQIYYKAPTLEIAMSAR